MVTRDCGIQIQYNTNRNQENIGRIPDIKYVLINYCWCLNFDEHMSNAITIMKDNIRKAANIFL